ncbi:hypothetical protein Scep_019541 [Stephania cephalantha]|uniref:Uncharacterized protein n=1 Tax=Stephania cephalantha TaxID=152367 RepID=A0AAP0IBI4_9MAGN
MGSRYQKFTASNEVWEEYFKSENANELFNLRHAYLRNVVERLFGIFKSRFTIFKMTPPFPFKIQAEAGVGLCEIT